MWTYPITKRMEHTVKFDVFFSSYLVVDIILRIRHISGDIKKRKRNKIQSKEEIMQTVCL